MVGAIKRWMGIKTLERENLILAKALQRLTDRVSALESAQQLTPQEENPKIIAKPAAPKRVNWRQAREALEKASDSQEEQ
jgi:hypothetical protein